MTDGAPEKGVVYVATKDTRFVEEAALSAGTLKRHAPEIPVWLFTDQTETPLLRTKVFDRVVPIETCRDYGDESAGAKIDRLRVLTDAPFDRCLQIDTDTRILRPEIRDVFAFLDHVEIAMTECLPDTSISRGVYGRPMFNGGFVLFRRGEKTKALFEAWRDLSDRHFRLADRADLTDVHKACPYLAHVKDADDRRTLLRRDQLALAQLFSPEMNRFGLVYAQLSEGWNHRGMGERRRMLEPVTIDHRNAYKLSTVEDLLNVAFRRFGAGDRETAGHIYQHVIAQHAPDLYRASAGAIAKGFRSHPDPAFPPIGAAAERVLAAAPETPRWLVNAIRMCALHLLAEQTEIAGLIGRTIVERADREAPA